MVFSKWISNDGKDRELFYRLLDNELVLCNDGEFGINNEEILAAKDRDRKFIFSSFTLGLCPEIIGWFRSCVGI